MFELHIDFQIRKIELQPLGEPSKIDTLDSGHRVVRLHSLVGGLADVEIINALHHFLSVIEKRAAEEEMSAAMRR